MLRRHIGRPSDRWVPPDQHDAVVEPMTTFSTPTEQAVKCTVTRLGVAPEQYNRWTARCGRFHTANGPVPTGLDTQELELLAQAARVVTATAMIARR